MHTREDLSITTEAILVRYGAIAEVARFANVGGAAFERGSRVVVITHRGMELGTVLDRIPTSESAQAEGMATAAELAIIRSATDEDEQQARTLLEESQLEFESWCERIRRWNLQLELIDLEWTLDREKRILYVICDRGPDSTKLALQAAGNGYGLIHVQPINEDGPVQVAPPGSSGCGCSDGGCSR